MTFYRGQDGYMALGGLLEASGGAATIVSSGAVLAAATTFSIGVSSGALIGTVAVGDTFTVAGEAGSPTHTVTGTDFYVAAASVVSNVTFTPASAGWADQAVVTFTSNAIANVVQWSLQTSQDLLDADVMGISWKQYVGGLGSWTGSMQVRLDLGDPRQLALQAHLITTTPDGLAFAVTFGINKGATVVKQFYGGVVLRNIQFTNQLNQLATMQCDFTGSGNPVLQWLP